MESEAGVETEVAAVPDDLLEGVPAGDSTALVWCDGADGRAAVGADACGHEDGGLGCVLNELEGGCGRVSMRLGLDVCWGD